MLKNFIFNLLLKNRLKHPQNTHIHTYIYIYMNNILYILSLADLKPIKNKINTHIHFFSRKCIIYNVRIIGYLFYNIKTTLKKMHCYSL